MKTELILATFDQKFNRRLENSGQSVIVSADHGTFNEVYDPEFLMLGSRHTLDKHPDYTHIRQLIPYVVVRCQGDIAVYSRTAKSTESRLHDMLSIGFGGHIDLDDIISNNSHVDVKQTIINSCYRELHEELNIEIDNVVVQDHWTNREQAHMHIISNEDAVGTVHLGMLYLVEVSDRNQLVVEPELNFTGWFPETYLRANLSDEFSGLEGWSRAVFAQIDLFDNIPPLPMPGE